MFMYVHVLNICVFGCCRFRLLFFVEIVNTIIVDWLV
jgi:hypothetical protein